MSNIFIHNFLRDSNSRNNEKQHVFPPQQDFRWLSQGTQEERLCLWLKVKFDSFFLYHLPDARVICGWSVFRSELCVGCIPLFPVNVFMSVACINTAMKSESGLFQLSSTSHFISTCFNWTRCGHMASPPKVSNQWTNILSCDKGKTKYPIYL